MGQPISVALGIVTQFIVERTGGYHEATVEQRAGEYQIDRFERVSAIDTV